MKKLSLLIAAFALVLGFSQCRKPNLPALNGETQHVVLNASWDNGGSKIEQVGSLLKWTTDDKLTVTGGATGTLSCTDAANGTFEGEITKGSGEDITFTFKSEKYKEDLMEQTGALNDAIKLLSDPVGYKPNGDYGVVEMKMSGAAVLKLDLSYFAPSSSKEEVTVEISVKAEGKDGSGAIASVKCASAELGEVYVAVPAKETPATYTFSDGSGKTVEKSWDNPLVGNTFFTADGNGGAEVIEPAAPTTPKFTVAAGKTVEFSKGNLWYGKADGEETAAFHFEKNQWDFASTWNASHVSHFKWSDKDNAVTSDGTCSGDLFCASNFTVDGDSHTDWRTLSKDEWEYLLNTSGSSGRTDASRFAKANVKGVCGLLIFPDNYSGTASGTGIADVNVTDAEFPTSDIPNDTWTSMETSGAVFLPAAGGREGTGVDLAGSDGGYWSSTPYEKNEDFAYFMYFFSDVVVASYSGRYFGCAFRLVRDVN